MKRCSKCKNEKTYESFYKDCSVVDGRARYCIKCFLAYRKDPKNKKAIRRAKQKYNKKHVLTNKQKIKRKEAYKKRYSNDLLFRLKVNLRNRLRMAIKNRQKIGSAVIDLGCSVSELMVHLEKQFYKHPITGQDMTWNNWGRGKNKWNIDHILELQQVKIDNEEDFKKVNHFTNLQPLWWDDHIKKSVVNKSKHV